MLYKVERARDWHNWCETRIASSASRAAARFSDPFLRKQAETQLLARCHVYWVEKDMHRVSGYDFHVALLPVRFPVGPWEV